MFRQITLLSQGILPDMAVMLQICGQEGDARIPKSKINVRKSSELDA